MLSKLKRGTISKTWDRDGSVLQNRSTISDNSRSRFIGTATTASIQGTKKRRSPGNHLTKSLPYPSRASKFRSVCRPCEKEDEEGNMGQRRAVGVDDKGRGKRSESHVPDRGSMFSNVKVVAGPKTCRRQVRAIQLTRRSAYRIRPDGKATW